MKAVTGKFGRAVGFWLCSLVLSQSSAYAQADLSFAALERPALTASLESSGNQYLLILDNNSAFEFRGLARLSFGKEGNQTAAGQLPITLPPNGSRSLLLNSVNATGEQYTLQIFDQKGTLIFYKVAPLRAAAGEALTNAEAVSVARVPPVTSAAFNLVAPTAAGKEPPTSEVQIKPRLFAGTQDASSFTLSFEIVALKAIFDASLSVAIGKAKQRKEISINKQTVVEFILPEYLESNQVTYKLVRKDGSVIAEGATDLDKLFADDHVTVADIRTDRVSYGPGEAARITVVLEGQSPHGFKLEVLARDYSGNPLFTNTVYGGPSEEAKEKEFTVLLPGGVKGPVIFEFKVYDGETGMLFDSGEREIAVKEANASS